MSHSSTFVRKFLEAESKSHKQYSSGIEQLQADQRAMKKLKQLEKKQQQRTWENYQDLRRLVSSDFSLQKLTKLQNKVLKAVKEGRRSLICKCYYIDGYWDASFIKMVSGKYHFYADVSLFHRHMDEILENLAVFEKIRAMIPLESLKIEVEKKSSYCIVLYF